MIFLDTETCGLHGVAVFLQYAVDDGEIILYNLWKENVSQTILLLESLCDHEVCGFNLAFDWFHIQKLYTLFSLFYERYGDHEPQDYINEIAALEKEARTYDAVLKPKAACDLMLLARKGPYQSLMARKAIRVKRVPVQLAQALANELESRIEIDGIYFSKRKDKTLPHWQLQEYEDSPEFRDVVLRFSASGALKVLAEHVLEEKPKHTFKDIELSKKLRPYEVGWAPFALSTKEKGWRIRLKKNGKTVLRKTWPAVVKYHINHWAFNDPAREYAKDDVHYTRGLYHAFGKPEAGDDDSELACMVGCVRWRGFEVNIERLQEMRERDFALMKSAPIAPTKAKPYLMEVMDEMERVNLKSTNKVTLENIANWECDCLLDGEKCTCGGHPAANRAQEIIDARQAKKRIELYDKLIQAGRFHASFKVIGTLSSRMSGSDGLNAQGINHSFEIRDCFPLADAGFQLDGGDFDSFEVVLADAAYNDPALRRELTEQRPCQKCDATGEIICYECEHLMSKSVCKVCKGSGILGCDECKGTKKATYKIHGLFGMEVSGLSYAEVIKSKGSKEKDWYSIGKSGVFAMIYGGDWNTLVKKQGIDPERAQKAESGFIKRFPEIQVSRQKIFDAFCSMRQPKGIGSQVVWAEPEDKIESLFGFPRFFTLENKICKALFELANSQPPEWGKIRIKVQRRDRDQYVGGATSSAIYACAFAIQAANMRAAANHVIQSSGATVTKRVQRRIWDIQPPGVHAWRVVPMNIHDEIACPTRPEYSDQVEEVVSETVETFRPRVPLIKIDWVKGASSWATMK